MKQGSGGLHTRIVTEILWTPGTLYTKKNFKIGGVVVNLCQFGKDTPHLEMNLYGRCACS